MGISVRPHLRRAPRRTAWTLLAATTRRDRSAAVRGESIGSLFDRPELRIRDLRDDPRLRLAMGLDTESTAPRPEPRFDRRRLLDRAAA